MMDVYESCPVIENERYKLRLLEAGDVDGLLAVYSDKRALPYFNSDNCDGDNFYYPTFERMREAVQFWLDSYKRRDFVRFTIVDKLWERIIGTVELFRRRSWQAAPSDFPECGLLRLDLASEYERSGDIVPLLALIETRAYELFGVNAIATKAPAYAVERVDALLKRGYVQCDAAIPADRVYYDYYIRKEKEEPASYRRSFKA